MALWSSSWAANPIDRKEGLGAYRNRGYRSDVLILGCGRGEVLKLGSRRIRRRVDPRHGTAFCKVKATPLPRQMCITFCCCLPWHIPAPPAVVFTLLTDEPAALSSLGGLKLRLSSSRRETEVCGLPGGGNWIRTSSTRASCDGTKPQICRSLPSWRKNDLGPCGGSPARRGEAEKRSMIYRTRLAARRSVLTAYRGLPVFRCSGRGDLRCPRLANTADSC